MKLHLIYFFLLIASIEANPPLYWWEPSPDRSNFGDALSALIVERVLGHRVEKADIDDTNKLLAIGSILQFAMDGDIVWGAGINGKHPVIQDYHIRNLDVRAVRGPLSRCFLRLLGIEVPEIYGDPALLLPKLCPEFKKEPKSDYLVIPHISEIDLFPQDGHVVYPDEPWDVIVEKIVKSKFVIASSLHGIIVAEAFGIPTRWLRVTENEPKFKYHDYYLGTGRHMSQCARSVEEALKLGGERPIVIDLNQLMEAFPMNLFEDQL